jgi:assimilatory nitrate reductase catalytic subunit
MNELFQQREQEETFQKKSKTQCPYCSMQCTMYLVEERSLSKPRYHVLPNKKDPVVQGRLCIKGTEAHIHALSSERLRVPLLRKKGKLMPVSWIEAMEWFSKTTQRIQKRFGKEAIGVFGGGSLTNEEAYLLGKFARVALQTPYIDYNGRFCMSSAAAASQQAFGIDRGLTNPLSDLPLAKCIILAGTNVGECQPTLIPYLRKAKANGAFLIAIDPRVTVTTKLADLHLQIRPGTDVPLVNGMLKVLWDEGYVNHDFIHRHTTGFDALQAFINTISLEETAQKTGIPLEKIIQAARAYGQAETGFVLTARGTEQHTNGVVTVRNYINLVLVTGKIGQPGSGFGTITGQGNGQGGREHGQKADQLPGYRRIDHLPDRKAIAKIWGIEERELPPAGVSATEMFRLAMDKKLRGMIIFASNPVVSHPDSGLVEKALEQLDFVICSDLFLSETAQKADLVLPAASYLEDEGTITNLEGRVLLRRAVHRPPGEAKPDWQIIKEMAGVLGKESFFPYESAESIFSELRRASHGGIADYSGITYQRIEQEGGIFWPCSDERSAGTPRLFTDRQFYHPDKKARLLPVSDPVPAETTDDDYPLWLTTGRVMPHYLSGTLTRRTPKLNNKAPEPFLYIHPVTAERYQLKEGMMARLASRRGEIALKVKLVDAIRLDTVFCPMHWGENQCINRITLPELDPVSRMPSFKLCAVRVEPLELHSDPYQSSEKETVQHK